MSPLHELTLHRLSLDVHVHIIPRKAKDFEPLDESTPSFSLVSSPILHSLTIPNVS